MSMYPTNLIDKKWQFIKNIVETKERKRKHGSPEKERSSELIFIVSQTKDRAAAGYQVRKMYAGDCR